MPLDERGDTPPEGIEVERPLEPQTEGDAVRCAVWGELVEKPQSPL